MADEARALMAESMLDMAEAKMPATSNPRSPRREDISRINAAKT